MSSYRPLSLAERAVSVCLGVLLGATALYIAVQLIEAVWTALLVILGVGAFVAAAVAIMRSRSRGW